MTIEEFNSMYANKTSKQKVETICEQCHLLVESNKEKAAANIKQNGRYVCRKCRMAETAPNRVYSAEARQKIAEAASKPRSEETRRKMSEAKKRFYESKAGKEWKLGQSQLTAKGHSENKFERAKRNGWFKSEKAGRDVFYGSSYELRLCWLLEHDDNVSTFETQVVFHAASGRGRCIDCVVTFKDGAKKAIEVKPVSRLHESEVDEQINDTRAYALNRGWQFEVCTEHELGMSERELREWADEYIFQTTGEDLKEIRRKAGRRRVAKHYYDKIAQDKVEVFCEYCQQTHIALALTYNKNITRNGRYICEREGGHLVGSRPRPVKVDLLAAEGKKRCALCKEVKVFDQFGKDSSRRDGYSSRCVECRARPK